MKTAGATIRRRRMFHFITYRNDTKEAEHPQQESPDERYGAHCVPQGTGPTQSTNTKDATESSHRHKSRVCVKRVLRVRYPQVDIVNGHLMLGRPVRANPLSYFEVKEGKRREEEA